MSTKVVMEALSPTMEEGRVVEWKKQEGEAVAVGDVLAEVETDKAVMELVARAAGTMLKHVVAAGATVPVSELVAVIGEPGEAVEAGGNGKKAEGRKDGKPDAPAAAEPAKPAPAKPDSAKTEAPTPGAPAPGTQPTADRENRPTSMPPAPPAAAATEGGRVKASPLARKIAAERGLDLQGVAGSGPQGRIVQRDLAALSARPATAAAAPQVPAFRPIPAGEPFADVPLTQIRKTIARRLAQSLGPVPTFYLTIEVDMERVAEAREALNAAGQGKISFNDITIKAVALALRQHPACNAWWQDDHIRYWNEVHVSMAVAIEDGLITPVIRHADQKGLRQIAAESKDLAGRARERKLAPEEYTGGTFSVSNLGMLDIEEFTAIINPPEAGIIAIGRIAEKPVVHEGTIVPRKRMRLTMSCDHRVIDGATGAQFLQTLKGMLENPLALVW
ncbi:MAG TPA: dihydrolipoamide acetyltransferase family protein [Gemmatimonadales bacterium]|jgi:pyruvate dehydrogenase E2 component (dihydrolipoamide acetyltransferase)|nr:dihydrolipoamide acetyltransferase family protein [Gemmatimonadales bacterium]